ncbi:scoloptoxin SSD976-like [Uranotaenia lowii]|nr:scoloptoxin SSD976-like [Uranotaenia lowii]
MTQPTPLDIVQSIIDVWFNEYKVTSPNYTDSYPMNYKGPQIGHFTVFVNDKVTQIGCCFARYEVDPDDLPFIPSNVKEGVPCQNYYFVCNYSYTNYYKEASYIKSDKPATKCESTSTYTGLCGVADQSSVKE